MLDLAAFAPMVARIRPPRVSRRKDPLWTRAPAGNLFTAVLAMREKSDLAAYLRGRLADGMRPIPEWALPKRSTLDLDLPSWTTLFAHRGWLDSAPLLGPRQPFDELGMWTVNRRRGAARLVGPGAPIEAPTVYGREFVNPAVPTTERGAEGKARDLLREFLTPEQRLDYLATRSFRVRGSDGRAYVVNDGNGGRKVEELDTAGRVVERWCLVGDERVDRKRKGRETWPVGDVLLTQKLLLESDAREFRRLAIRILDKKVPLRFVRLMCYLMDHPTSTDVWNAVLRVTKTKRPKVVRVGGWAMQS